MTDSARLRDEADRPIPFVDLQAQRARIGPEIDAAIQRVLAHGAFILGPENRLLEKQLADFAGVRHALACSNGTDALILALSALEIGAGDAVFVPAFNFAAAAEAVALLGATPVFVDVSESDFNIDATSLARGIEATLREGKLRPGAVIAVDLFGQPADYGAILPLAARHGLKVVADAAQSFGASYGGSPVGSLGDIATTSFFPAKPLGCYGDGGAVLTDDDRLADTIRSLRAHGQGVDKYDNVRLGRNARLDTMQAAILLEKLKIFPDEIESRQRIAERYDAALGQYALVPRLSPGRSSVWAQYTLILQQRDRVQAALAETGIPTAIYYRKPLNRQDAYAGCPTAPGGTPESDRLAQQVLSLPMHPYLERETQDRIVRAIIGAIDASRGDIAAS